MSEGGKALAIKAQIWKPNCNCGPHFQFKNCGRTAINFSSASLYLS